MDIVLRGLFYCILSSTSMKNITVFLSAVLVSAIFSYSGFAQNTAKPDPIRKINYQGLLLDAANHPVTGSHHITIRLYDAPLEGNMLHTENFISDVANGVFSVVIGSEQPIESLVRFDKQYWVGVSVEDAGELSPRTALTSVPYAIRADMASSLAKGATGAVTSMNGRSGDITIKGGAGTSVQTDGSTITITAMPSGSLGHQQTQATNVNSVTGTVNQITASPTTGNVVLSLPQDINNGASPTFTGMTLSGLNSSGLIHTNGSGVLSTSTLVNNDVAANAAIAYTKLSLAGKIVNSDVANNAAIAYTKLSLTGNIVNTDIAAGANIAASKLNLTNAITSGDIVAGTIVNSDINAGAGIAYTKLNLIGSISNNDVAAGANIAASKLNLTNAITSGDIVAGTIVNSDINAGASIAYTKLNLIGSISNNDVAAGANIAANKLNLTNAITSGDIVAGTIVNSDINAGANIAASKLNLTNAITSGDIVAGTIVNSDINAAANIAASKINLANAITSGDIVAGTIVNSDINGAAGIAYTKLNLIGSISNADVAAGAAISDAKLATISSVGKVSNTATTATSANNANTIALRDGSGNFSAGTITATLNGNATNVNGTVAESHGGTGITTYTKGDILYSSAANTLSKLGVGAVGQVLTISGGVPAWAALSGVGVTSIAGTANQVFVNGGTAASIGAITLSLPQSINNGASPTFAGMTLSGMNTVGVVHNNASGVLSNSLIVDADISGAAAIADSKLATISSAGKVANTSTTATASNTNNAIVSRDASGNFNAGTITASLTGNVTGNVIGNVTGTLTGNITGNAANVTGVVSEVHGGTNQSAYLTGDLLYASSATTLARKAIGTSGQVLTVSAGIPVWSTVAANVASVIGTADEILVNGDILSHTGAVTLTTPQAIGTSSSPTFASLSLTAKATSASTGNADIPTTLTTKDYVDNIASEYWNIGGNTGLNSSTNYFGTNDGTDLVFKTNSSEALRLTNGGSLLLGGTSGSVPTLGSGTRMMWIPSLGAIRAGGVDGSEWNTGSVGQNSVAMGYSTTADGNYSVAMGYYASADGVAATALGSATAAYVDGATALGSASQASGINSVAMGDNATSTGIGSVAMGSNTIANGLYSTAMGSNTTATGDLSIAMGSKITVGTSSLGYNSGSNASVTMDISGMSGVAYFGDADLLIGNDDNAARSLKFYGSNNSATLSGAHFTAFKAQTQSADINYLFPASQGAANSLLLNNGSGSLSWSTLSNLTIPTGSGTANNLAIWSSSSVLGAGSNLYYSSNKLGIGVSNPSQALDVSGNANISGTMTSGGISMSGGSAVLSYSTISAGATITIPNTAVVKITDDGANVANAVTMPTGANGQIIYIYNNDAQTTTGDITLANGSMGVYIYVDGWRKAN